MDIGLPGTDGITATRQITRAFPQGRVIIVTEYGSTRLRDAAQSAGASGDILKENLREVIGALMS
jgi:DNA-binding NarL/FixJ family response regulator